MQLDVRDAAAAFKVPQSTIYRWIDEKKLPATGVDGHYRFGRAELLEWATAHHLDLPCDLFCGPAKRDHQLLAPALDNGGIFYDVPGANNREALDAVVNLIPMPPQCDRELLLQLFLAREAMGSTAVGHGIAIPHPRHPLVLSVDKPFVFLCFLANKIEFGDPAGQAVSTLFVLISPTVPVHLQMLARVAAVLRDPRCLDLILNRQPRLEILSEVRRVDAAAA